MEYKSLWEFITALDNVENEDIDEDSIVKDDYNEEDYVIKTLPVIDNSPSLFKDLFIGFVAKAFEDFRYPYHEDIEGFENFIAYVSDMPEEQLREAIDDILSPIDDIRSDYLPPIHHHANNSNELQESLEKFYEYNKEFRLYKDNNEIQENLKDFYKNIFHNTDYDFKDIKNVACHHHMLGAELFSDIEDIIVNLTEGAYRPYRYTDDDDIKNIITRFMNSDDFDDEDNIIDKDDLNDKDNISEEDNDYDDDFDEFENDEYDDIDENSIIEDNYDEENSIDENDYNVDEDDYDYDNDSDPVC